MTKEKLEIRLREYQAQFEQLKANANAMQGAIQAVQQLITEIDAEAATQTKVE
jgi:prefoldin subunit 5